VYLTSVNYRQVTEAHHSTGIWSSFFMGAFMPDALQLLTECAWIDLQFARLDLELDGGRQAIARALFHIDEVKAHLTALLLQMPDDYYVEEDDAKVA